MPSTVYRGDLSEITFGTEAGVRLEHDYNAGANFTQASCSYNNSATITHGANASIVVGLIVSGTGIPTGAHVEAIVDGTHFTLSAATTGGNLTSQTLTFNSDFTFRAGGGDKNTEKDTSIISFRGGIANTPVNGGLLRYPRGMLVGSRVVFSIKSSCPNWSTQDDYAVSGRMYTIIKQEVATSGDNASCTEITLTPALQTNHVTNDADSKANDVMTILPFATPAIDVSMSHNSAASSSEERVLTDQFVGLVSTVALPETKVDLKRFHVVGLGRDVAVQVPGRFLNTGGTFECNIHNGRWFKYCLGQEVVQPHATTKNTAGGTHILSTASNPGDSYIETTDNAGTVNPIINSIAVGVGDYVILDTAAEMIDVQTYRETAVGGGAVDDAWPAVNATNIFDKAIKEQTRRIVAITGSNGDMKIWLNQPLDYGHPISGTTITFARYASNNANGSPNKEANGNLQYPVQHLFFSRTTIPSFSMEVSVRRNDSDGNETDVVDGGPSDTKQLTRIFRGCKMKEWSLTADTDAALRLTAQFDSAFCYTDTGRLEASSKGDRYDAHRLFEDTANTEVKRKESGIEKGTQKPFMFYNGTITVLNTQLGQVVSFTINGKTGVEQYYTINGANVADAATDQVPFAGSRNPKLAVEGKTEYDMEMEIIVDDPLFYHNMRRAVTNHDEDTSDSVDVDQIRLSFVKQGSGADRESIDILMDDYYITEAPLPIPEDKGPMRAKLKIMPKSIKIIAKDTVLAA